MQPHRILTKSRVLILSLVFVCAGSALRFVPGGQVKAKPVPARLSDEQFWKLSTTLSESDGSFRAANLLSNELNFQYVIPSLLQKAKQGRVYMGVGPEQNFTYIVALKPAMAFI